MTIIFNLNLDFSSISPIIVTERLEYFFRKMYVYYCHIKTFCPRGCYTIDNNNTIIFDIATHGFYKAKSCAACVKRFAPRDHEKGAPRRRADAVYCAAAETVKNDFGNFQNYNVGPVVT